MAIDYTQNIPHHIKRESEVKITVNTGTLQQLLEGTANNLLKVFMRNQQEKEHGKVKEFITSELNNLKDALLSTASAMLEPETLLESTLSDPSKVNKPYQLSLEHDEYNFGDGSQISLKPVRGLK